MSRFHGISIGPGSCASGASSSLVKSRSRSSSLAPRSSSSQPIAARQIGPGFDLTHTLRAEVNLPSDRYTTPERLRSYIERTLPELEALPGISAVAAARIIPFTDSTRFTSGMTFPDTGEKIEANFSWNAVSAGFFPRHGYSGP